MAAVGKEKRVKLVHLGIATQAMAGVAPLPITVWLQMGV
jgi:hypothetical protein